MLDEAVTNPGLFIATGFSGHGFGVEESMAQMALGRTPPEDLGRFRFSRFSDGVPMRPGPGL